MRSLLKFAMATIFILFAAHLNAQVMLSAWLRNTTGKTASYWASSGGPTPTFTFTTTTADVLAVAYNSSYVYVRSNGMTDSMGQYLNPGNCVAQAYTHKFPQAQTVPTTKTISPKVGQIGLLINGVPIYGLSNANSWNGSSNVPMGTGVWNVEVGKSEGFVLDATLGAHPQMQGAYHSHDKPYRLYAATPTSQHSPIIGFAFDGYPVYGPYGYSLPLDATSAVTRMKSGYSLRNITTRTTLPYGVAASQTGPAVSTTYPLGTYCEDYEWLASNGGDLDKYNGRFCVTPEYPAGTYAYFVTIDAAGAAQFPYYIGIEYYGAPETTNFPHGPSGNGLTIPSSGVTYYTGGTLAVKLVRFDGRQAGNVNVLNWILTNAEGSSKVFLERSTNGVSFSEVAVFTAASQFEYTDQHPQQRNFYRLKIVGPTGGVIYSSVVTINNNTKSTINVYPTISTGAVKVQGLNSTSTTRVVVSDALGRSVLTSNVAAGQEQVALNLSSLTSGMYFVAVENNGYKETSKIVRQ